MSIYLDSKLQVYVPFIKIDKAVSVVKTKHITVAC